MRRKSTWHLTHEPHLYDTTAEEIRAKHGGHGICQRSMAPDLLTSRLVYVWVWESWAFKILYIWILNMNTYNFCLKRLTFEIRVQKNWNSLFEPFIFIDKIYIFSNLKEKKICFYIYIYIFDLSAFVDYIVWYSRIWSSYSRRKHGPKMSNF